MAENTNRVTNAGLIIRLWLKWRMTSDTAACLLGERRAPAFRSGMFRLTEFRTGHPLVRTNFGNLLERLEHERRSLVIEKRGTPRAVLLSCMSRRPLSRSTGKSYRAQNSRFAGVSGSNSCSSSQNRPILSIPGRSADPNDNMFLECADAARAVTHG
jgi:hypothetical protein